ncbi:MAG: PAS domain S-box protein [Lacunisphaera sp.]
MPDSARISPTVDQLQARLTEVERQLADAEEALRQGEANRRESQDFFAKTFQTIPALMIITRLSDGTMLEANAGFERASGYTRAEIIGRTTTELKLWADLRQRNTFVAYLRKDGRVRDFDGVFRDKHGKIVHLLLNGDLVEINGITCTLTVGVDFGERLRREQVQNATYQISRAVLAGTDLPTLFAELHGLVATLMAAKNFYVALLNADGTMLSFPYFVDETAEAPADRRPGTGLTEYVLQSGKPLLTTADELTVVLRDHNRYVPVGEPAALWLGAPLLIDGRAIGVIAVQDYRNANAYGQEEKRLLMFVADQAAAAVYRRRSEALQRESQDYFAKSFQASPALTALLRLDDGRIMEANTAFLHSSGYTREEVMGRTAGDLSVWSDPVSRLTFMELLRKNGTVRDYEAVFYTKKREPRYVSLNSDILELEGTRCMLITAIDRTERRRREQVQDATYQISRVLLTGGDLPALFAEVHRLIAGLMPARNFYVALLNGDGSLVSFPYFVDEYVPDAPSRPPSNRFTEHILRTGRAQLVTAGELEEILTANGPYQTLEKPAAVRLGAPLLIDGHPRGVIALQDYDNPTAYGEEALQLLLFVAGQAAAAVQRRQAEDALARAEQQYRGIFEHALEGLYQSRPDGHFERVNPALAQILGYDSPSQLITDINDIGRQFYADPERRNEFMQRVKSSDEVIDFESEVVRRNGAKIWISESVRVFRNPKGEPIMFEGVAIDITARREAARTLQAAKDAADTANRAKSQFLASMSHELRTPLNGILGYTQILRRDPSLSDKQSDGLSIIHQSADHLLAVINDVLDLAKIEARKLELHPAEFDLHEFVDRVQAFFQPRAREKNLLLETAFSTDLPHVVIGDAQRLRQVAFNLLGNAVKFTSRGGVVFSAEKIGEKIRFSVSDTGPGIAAEDQSRLFEPFSQIGDHKRHAEGTGLGLNVSRGIVEQMGGRLLLESRAGWGSRFWFEVPLPTAAAETILAPTIVPRRIAGYAGKRRRVLIADDHSANRSLLVDLLSPLGFEVVTAVDGTEVITLAKERRPDIILLDLRMPRMDGFTAARAIREFFPTDGPLIIGISASAFLPDRQECLDAGCTEFLAKPFREEQLLSVLERQLELQWHYIDVTPVNSNPPFPIEQQAPDPADALALFELASKGDVIGVRTYAQKLAERDPRLGFFTQHIIDLSARFKMKAIRQAVARYLPAENSET